MDPQGSRVQPSGLTSTRDLGGAGCEGTAHENLDRRARVEFLTYHDGAGQGCT